MRNIWTRPDYSSMYDYLKNLLSESQTIEDITSDKLPHVMLLGHDCIN